MGFRKVQIAAGTSGGIFGPLLETLHTGYRLHAGNGQ